MSPITHKREQLRTTAEVAVLLGKSASTIKQHARTYDIGTPLGRTRVFTEQDIQRLREISARGPGVKKRSAP